MDNEQTWDKAMNEIFMAIPLGILGFMLIKTHEFENKVIGWILMMLAFVMLLTSKI